MKTNQPSILAAIMIAVTTVFMGAAHATDFDWDGGADPDRNWTTGTNWVGDLAPASGDDVEFLAAGIGVVQVDNPVTVGSIRFLNPGYTLPGNQITIDPTDRWGIYDIYSQGTGSNQIDSALQLNGAVRILTGGGHKLIINGVISDGTTAGSISSKRDSNSRVLSLRGANTYTGGTSTNGMRLELGDNSALGTGTWTLDAPVSGQGFTEQDWTYVDVTKDIAINNAVSIKTDMIFSLYSEFDGTLTLNGPISIDAAGVTIREGDYNVTERLELAGTITNNGNNFTLNTQQNNEILLGGDNNITGTVTWVANGSSAPAVLAIGNDKALGTGTLKITQGVNTGRGGQIIADGLDVVIDNDIVVDGNLGVSVGDPAGNSVTLTGEFSSTGGSSFSRLQINAGSTLAGTGTITAGAFSSNDQVYIGPTAATLAPGNTGNYGTLTINGDLEFANDTSIFQVDLKDAVAGTGYDQLLLNGAVKLDKAQLVLNLDAAPRFEDTDLAFILVNDGVDAISGDYWSFFDGLNDGATISLGTVLGLPASAQISYFGDSVLGASTGGNDIVLYNFTNAFIPEPSTFAITLLGLGCLVRRRSRTQK